MAIAGSPKKMVQDIAEGFMSLSPPMLKAYTPADLKTIIVNLGIVSRELRQVQVAQDDVMAAKAKNMKLSRLNQAEIVIRAFCKKQRIPL
jgi:hypothetical protein